MGSMFEAQHRTSTRMGLQASRATNLRGCRCNHVTSSIECIHWGVHSIKDQLLSLDQPQKFQQLKDDALKCDTCYWEHQGEKATPSGWNRQSASTSTPAKSGNNLTASSDAPMTSHTNPGIGADGKLTQEEWEHRCLKGLCYYCSVKS